MPHVSSAHSREFEGFEDRWLPVAGADLRLLQKAMGHASITVTAHTYADLFDDELDNIAAALDSLSDDLSQST